MRALIPAGIEALPGTAEAIPLADASVDAVTVAQAFQWFRAEQALAEIGRVLRPGGVLALVANLRDESDPLQQAFAETLARHRAHPVVQADLDAVRPVEIRRFEHVHELRSNDLPLLAASESSIATLDDGARASALAEIAALVPPGADIRLRYVTEVRIRSGGT
jgi:SAM-dependent methyltransferase